MTHELWGKEKLFEARRIVCLHMCVWLLYWIRYAGCIQRENLTGVNTTELCVFVYLGTPWRENWTRQIKVLLCPHLPLPLPFFQSKIKSQSTYRSEIHIAWHFASQVGLCASIHQCPTERADIKVYMQKTLFHIFLCMFL